MKAESVIEFRKPVSIQQMSCTVCGAQADASCNCGAPYLPAKKKAERALAEHPEKSNRAIAADIGVDEGTVRAARKETAEDSAVDKRIGLDGKTRRMPAPQQEPKIGDADSAIGYATIRRRGFMQRAEESLRLAQCCDDLTDLSIDEEMITAVHAVASAWQEILERIRG